MGRLHRPGAAETAVGGVGAVVHERTAAARCTFASMAKDLWNEIDWPILKAIIDVMDEMAPNQLHPDNGEVIAASATGADLDTYAKSLERLTDDGYIETTIHWGGDSKVSVCEVDNVLSKGRIAVS